MGSNSHNPSWVFNSDQVQDWAFLDGLFTPEECAKIIDIGNATESQRAEIVGQAFTETVRDSHIAWVYPSENTDWIYRRVTDAVLSINSQFFNFDIFGLLEGFQFTRYDAPNGFYGAHKDKHLYGRVRKLSMTIQLSAPEDYEGGELAFWFGANEDIMDKEQGRALFFPSYILHEVKPVTRGTRYSLVAWVTGPPFK